ncbi:hypothetical protein [Nocardia tengchongensis]|uniref:hypothetical protein n=1 Tax=Nocardia tengchongensis TaxID=2055889 RepID=UPI00365958CA
MFAVPILLTATAIASAFLFAAFPAPLIVGALVLAISLTLARRDRIARRRFVIPAVTAVVAMLIATTAAFALVPADTTAPHPANSGKVAPRN